MTEFSFAALIQFFVYPFLTQKETDLSSAQTEYVESFTNYLELEKTEYKFKGDLKNKFLILNWN